MKLMVYPTSREVSALARYRSQVRGYEEILFVTPKGWGADGADFMSLDGGEPTGIQIHTDFEKALETVDAIFFTDGIISIPKEFLLEKVRQAIGVGKKVIFDQLPEGLELSEGITLLHSDLRTPFKKMDLLHPEICTIPVPVVFVMGIGSYTNKLEVQVALRKHFQEMGYRVSQVGSKRSASFFGFAAIPDAVYENKLSIREKVIALNRYFYRKYQQEKPDVMIIGIPGGIMQLNAIRFEELGELAFLVSQAAAPDAAVLCTYAHSYTQKYFDEVLALCKYKLNAVVKHVVVSGTDMTATSETRECEYSTVPISVIKENCMNQPFEGVELFYALDEADMERLGAAVVEQLLSNM